MLLEIICLPRDIFFRFFVNYAFSFQGDSEEEAHDQLLEEPTSMNEFFISVVCQETPER